MRTAGGVGFGPGTAGPGRAERTTLNGRTSSYFIEHDMDTLSHVGTLPFAAIRPETRLQESGAVSDEEFAQIYEANKARVYSTALRMLNNSADAEDVTQEVFIKVFNKIHTFEGRSQLSTWLYRITVNRSLDVLRKRKRTQAEPLEEAMGAMANPSNLQKVIESFIPTLPPGYRAVFVLHDIQGLKHHEIAKQLHITEGACKSQLHKARLMMRKKLKPFLEGIA
jgi:RNA polymerase sigma-70 factor, ECF subfamily